MFGMPKLPFGMLGVAGGSDTRPTNSPEDMSALQKLYAATQAANQTPNGRVARGFNQFGPQPTGVTQPMLPTPPTPDPVDPDNFAPAKQAPVLYSSNQPSPLDNAQWPAGPVGAPQPPAAPQGVTTQMPAYTGQTYNIPIGTDYQMPAFGPTPSAEASGPDVIQKLMSFFHNKDDPSST